MFSDYPLTLHNQILGLAFSRALSLITSRDEKADPAELFWKYIMNSVGVIENPY